jgi:hypothetical protein
LIVAIENPEVFVGMSLDDARCQIGGYGYTTRITKVDNHHIVVMKDYDPLRVNLQIEGNKVTKATIG